MGTDYVCCGTCSVRFPLSEFPSFIEHKKTACISRYLVDDAEELHCSQCVRSYLNARSLLCHIQEDHGLKVIRNNELADAENFKSISTLTTPFSFFDPIDEPFNPRLPDDNHPDHEGVQFPLPPPLSSETATESAALHSIFQTISTPANARKNPSCQGVQFRSLSYQTQGHNMNDLPMDLADTIRLIHRIACNSKLELPNMTSDDRRHLCSNSSSYAVSLCCSRSGVSCTVDTCSCTCSISSPRQLKTSTSSQTDGISDPEFPPISDKRSQLTLLPPPPLEFDFSSNLAQTTPPTFENSSVDLSKESDIFIPPSPLAALVPPKTLQFHQRQQSLAKVIPFTCSLCGLMYRQKIHLRKHIMAQHTKQKPFFCPHCPYATVEKSHLTVHIRTHTGERPFTCRMCNYSSAQNCTLKSHYLRRHPESKIACMECGGLFVTELELRNHHKNCAAASAMGDDANAAATLATGLQKIS